MRADFQLPPLDLQTVTDFVGKGSENLIMRVLAEDFSEDEVQAHFPLAMERYQHHYLAINGDFSTLYEGCFEGLLALKNLGMHLSCVTNKADCIHRASIKKKT